MHYKRLNYFITFLSHCKGTAHAKSVFISPYFLFDDNFLFRQIKQHILDKGLHEAFTVNDRGEKKERREREREKNCGLGEKLMKGILRYLVWFYNELILLVLGKFNYTQDNTCLNVSVNCMCVWVCFQGVETRVCVRTKCSSLSIHRADAEQTELRPEWQSECRFHANDQRALWLCAPTTKGFTVPMMSKERELRGRAGENKKGQDWRERGETTDEGYAEMKIEEKEEKEEKETESRMAKLGWKEAREQEWEMRNRWRKKGLRETEMKRKRHH